MFHNVCKNVGVGKYEWPDGIEKFNSNVKSLLIENVYSFLPYMCDLLGSKYFEEQKRITKEYNLYAIYLKSWLNLLVNVFAKYKLADTNYEQLEKIFCDLKPADLLKQYSTELIAAKLGLPELPQRLEAFDFALNIWGRRAWSFLHTFSIAVYNDDKMTNTFGILMLNFHLFIKCPVCFQHFHESKPLNTLTLAILTGADPIYTLFKFHNQVNKRLGSPAFSISQFEKKYQLRVKTLEMRCIEFQVEGLKDEFRIEFKDF